MNIFHELGRLQIAAREAEPFDQYRGIQDDDQSERIAGMRRLLLMDQARRRQVAGLEMVRRVGPLGDRRRQMSSVLIHGRVVSVPTSVVGVLHVLEAADQHPLTRDEIGRRAFGSTSRVDVVSQRLGLIDMALRFQDCGLRLHRHAREGTTLLAEPLTLVQAEEARAVS